jgi:hypothetical protein
VAGATQDKVYAAAPAALARSLRRADALLGVRVRTHSIDTTKYVRLISSVLQMAGIFGASLRRPAPLLSAPRRRSLIRVAAAD